MKRFINLNITAALAVSILFFSCRKAERKYPAPAKAYYQYFPLKAGAWKIYVMDSVNLLYLNDSMHYYMKEIVTNSFTDNSGETAYRIEQWIKKDSFDVWHISKVYTAKRTGQEAIVTMNNIPYVMLTFPVSADVRWNTNKYNNYYSRDIPTSELEDDFHRAQYLSLHQPYALNGMNFDSTILVRSFRDSLPNFSKLNFYERYASQIGLVDLRHDSIEWQPKGPGGSNVPYRGYKIYQKLLQYGD